MRENSCFFTGHRYISKEAIAKLKPELISTVDELVSVGIKEFICGGAVGFDMLAAESVIAAKEKYPNVKLVLAIPCRDHMRGWRSDDKRRMSEVMSLSDECVFVSPFYVKGCMHARNRYMADRASVCVAYMRKMTGGTGYTVAYAAKRNCHIINLAKKC